MNKNRRFYFISLAVLLPLSAYPLWGGVRMAYFSVTRGALEPEQYVKYVVPYAAICVSLLWYAALRPVFSKMARWEFAAGLFSAYGVFFAVELFFEKIQIHTTEMRLIDTSSLTADAGGATATADIWQAALCIVSPVVRSGSLTYVSHDSFFYVAGNSLYKIHYYMISLILITMVCGLIYGIANALPDNGRVQMRAVYLRGISTSALAALCVFANTTAFFRQAADIQTPLASVLTGVFFIVLGAAAGIYAGGYLLEKGRKIGIGVPVALSIGASALMYFGEAAMMDGNLYRFGTGWFFSGLPGIVLAPVDILIILLSGALTWLILGVTRKSESLPGGRTVIAAIVICAAVAAAGPVITLTASQNEHDSALGVYRLDKYLYINPLSSFRIETSGGLPFSSDRAYGGSPYIYGFDQSAFTITDTERGDVRTYQVEYCNTPVGADEFSSKTDFFYGGLPDLSQYKERYLLAVMSDGIGPEYGLYRMDGEIWIAEIRKVGIWSVCRIKKTDE